MNTTTNLGLLKPEYSDVADIKDINDNMDTLDGIIGALPEGATVQEQIDDINDEIGNTALPTTAQTLTGAIAEHETDLGTKLNKNQGSGNSGKVMVVDEDGEIVPTDFPSTPIDDTKGIGDTDYVWSADKDAKEALKIDGTKANTDSTFAYKETYGSVVEFDDGVSEAVKQMRIDIAPLQDLHGYDSPWVGGSGKNLAPLDLASMKALNVTGEWSGNTYTRRSVVFTVQTDDGGNITGINVNGTATGGNADIYVGGSYGSTTAFLPAGDYTATISDGITMIVGYNQSVPITTTSEQTKTFANGVAYIILRVTENTNISNKVIHPMLRSATVTDSTFEPYSNICPISGWTGAEVTRIGRNLLPVINTAGVTHNSVTWTNNGDGSWTANGTATGGNSYPTSNSTKQYNLGILPSGAYTVSVRDAFGHIIDDICNIRVGYGSSSTLQVSARGYASFTADGSTQYYFTFNVANGFTANNVRIYPQVEKGSVVTAYVAPQRTFDISFPSTAGTVYGGTLIVNQDGSGSLIVDRFVFETTSDIITADTSITTISQRTNTLKFWIYSATLPENSGILSSGDPLICDRLPTNVGLDVNTNDIVGAQSSQSYLRSYCLSIPTGLCESTASAIRTYINANPYQFCMKLKSPVPYELTTEQVIRLLSGQNTVYADCGDITLLYPTDKYLTAEQAEKERIHESITVSAPVQTIDDGADNVPMDVSVAIEPVQDLHGYNNPWVAGAGVNKFNSKGLATLSGYSGGITLTKNSDESITLSGSANSTAHLSNVSLMQTIPANTNVTISLNNSATNSEVGVRLIRTDSGGAVTNYGTGVYADVTNKNVTVSETWEATAVQVFVKSNHSAVSSITLKIQVEIGSSATTWSPYENICPISGWDKAEVTRTGKNLLNDVDWIKHGFYNPQGEYTADNRYISYLMNLPAGTYTFSTDLQNCYIIRYLINDTATSIAETKQSQSFTLSEYAELKIVIRNTSTSDISSVTPKSMIEKSATATTYEPFGTTYTIPFNTDVYGGSLMVNKDGTGTLVVEDFVISFDGGETWTKGANANYYMIGSTNVSALSKFYTANEGDGKFSCSHFEPVPYQLGANLPDGKTTSFIGTSGRTLGCKYNSITSVEDFKAYLGQQYANGTPLTFVLPLINPITYTIPASVIRSLLGTNNLFADTGNILSLNYSADIKTYIDNLFGSIIPATGISF